jgi:hypothetical protein
MPKLPRPFLCAHLVRNVAVLLIFVFPASTNFRLNEWSVGGGSEQGKSANFKAETVIDSTVGDQSKSTNYQINPGLMFVQMANVPPAPNFTNPADYYNKLHIILNTGANPSDTKFAVAISTDNFLTTNYVKADNTVGTTLTIGDWRDYASWGTGTGIDIVGLSPDTTYYVKVKAEQGDFTESGWGPMASTATSPASLTFDIDVAATDTETAPPYTVALGDLTPGSITTATDKIWTDFATNANSGGVVYVAGTNGGLKSTATNYTIGSITANLSGQSEGYGLKVSSITETSGGPFTAESPFNGGAENVGSSGTVLIPLSSSLSPLVGGRNSIDVKTIINSLTPGATDYTETLTLVAAGTF